MVFVLSSPAGALGKLQSEGAILKLKNFDGTPSKILGDWKLVDGHPESISPQEFEKMKDASPFQTSLFYMGGFEGPKNGSFILRIDADKNYQLSGHSFGIAARSRIILLHDSLKTPLTLYGHPDFQSKDRSNVRQQVKNLTIEIPLYKGTNYIVFSYEQDYQVRSGKKIVHGGFDTYFQIGETETIVNAVRNENVFLLIPLGIFLSLSIYSLLIWISRGRKDLESLLIASVNFTTFLKELGSQSLLAQFFETNGFIQLIHGSIFLTPILGSFFAIWVLRLTIDSALLRVLQKFCIINSILTAICGVVLLLGNNLPDLTMLNLGLMGLNGSMTLFVFVPYAIYKAAKIRSTDLILYATGIGCMTAGMVFDFAKVSYDIDWPWMAMWGGVVFSLALAKNNSSKFAHAYAESERLNVSLSQKTKRFKT